jgi:hypothetical protein
MVSSWIFYDFFRRQGILSFWGSWDQMALGLEILLAPATGYPASPIAEEALQRLNVAVVFTSVESTLVALREAANLASDLGARITLIVPQVVPFSVPLETPPVLVEFAENRFRALANESPVETKVQICYCRDRLTALKSALKPGSIVILAGPKRFWPTKDQRLARRLRGAGFEVIFKETE